MRARSRATATASISASARATRRRVALARTVRPPPVRVERRHQLVHALAAGRHGAQDRDPPPAALAEPDHVAQLAHGLGGAVAVGLVHHEDVGHLEDPGLRRLHAVAHARREQHDGRVGQRDDVDLGLADADRLDQHDVAPGRVEHAQGLRRGAREPAELARGWPSTG